MASINPTTSSVPPAEKLSFWTKASYAIGDLGNAVGVGAIIPFWYTFFLTDIAQLELGLVSLFWVIVTTWDAINNPLVGYLSDRTRTRWGRRRPFLLFGALPFGLLYIALWWLPPLQSQHLRFFYYLAAYILFETVSTLVVCPHSALMPELTQDHDERTTLSMYRMVVTIAAGVVVPVLFGLLLLPEFPAHNARPYQLLALICGPCFTLALLIAFFGTRERLDFQRRDTPSVRMAIKYIHQNVPFRYSLLAYVFGWMSVMVAQTLFAYYFMYWVGMGADEISLAQGVIMMSAWLLLPAVLWLTNRLEKKTAYIIAAGSWALIMLATLLIPQNTYYLSYVICGLSGFGIAAIHLVPSAMLPDVIEVDELASGYRQEGVYAGVSVFVGKIGRMVILALLPLMLHYSGYVQPSAVSPTPVQPDSALQTIRLTIAILPAVLLAASMVAAWFYPITRESHARIRQQLEERRTQPPAGN